jgi:two-component system sensor histidine kinase SenX3
VVILDEMTTEARLDRVKADLVANVSHELRTPLAAASSLLEALESSDLDGEQRARFEGRLRAQIRRMGNLVEDLLALSRLEGGGLTPQVESVTLAPLVQETFSTLAPFASSARVSLTADIPEGMALRGDRALLETALKNLVDNAIRYNRPGGSVTVGASRGDGLIALEVTDTGEGIAADHLDRIFERFYRVDPHRSREKGGTGLGLAIVKHVAAQLGGRVSVKSAPGRGSTFRIEIPDLETPEDEAH